MKKGQGIILLRTWRWNEKWTKLILDRFQSFDVFVPVSVAENGQDLVLVVGQRRANICQSQERLVQFGGRDFTNAREPIHQQIQEMNNRFVERHLITSE